MESTGRVINPKYAAMDNSVCELLMNSVGTDADWSPHYLSPSKAGDPQVWAQTHASMEKADFPATQMFLKVTMIFPDIPVEIIWNLVQMSKRNVWEQIQNVSKFLH